MATVSSHTVMRWVARVGLALVSLAGTLVAYQAQALPPIIDLSNENPDLTVRGENAGDLSGVSTAAGDVNGDGIDDLIFGIGGFLIRGKAYVVFGGPTLPSVIDLDGASADVTLLGEGVGDQFGLSVSAADINGDGIEDLILGSHLAGSPSTGKTYVIYGRPEFPAVTDIDSIADFTVVGESPGDQFGRSVGAGDLNGDGVDDLIVGAVAASPSGRTFAGAAYAIYGGPDLPATLDLANASADVTVLGGDAFDQFGASVSAGDIDGDGTDDLIVGAPMAGPNVEGAVYVTYGDNNLPSSIDLASSNADLTAFGTHPGGQFGGSVAAGDINGDGTDDLVVGSWHASPAGGTFAGETNVIYGHPSLPSTIQLDSPGSGLVVQGDNLHENSGFSVFAGDVDADGIDDLIIGAPGAVAPAGGDSPGKAYLIYGGEGLPSAIDLNDTSADVTFVGNNPIDRAGWSVASGDINGDGIGDLILGAILADPGGRTDAGETYVIYGDDEKRRPRDTLGDVDCSGAVNAIDATLILQRSAGLTMSLACEESADVNADGLVNSIDSALVLQHVAGLVDTFGAAGPYMNQEPLADWLPRSQSLPRR